jgi:hypothetical protein
MDEHELDSDELDEVSTPERRIQDFLALRLVGLGEGESLPADYGSTRMEEYWKRLASLEDDLTTLGQ